jgi:16S rRNA (cytosine1402-N4)-methyltransferase
MSTYHRSVLLHESLDALGILPEGVYVDVTFGGGGHSKEILKRLGSAGRLIAFDQDEDAVRNAPSDPRFTLVKKNFSELKSSLHELGISSVNGILADLGVSSHQFDTAKRGFSTRFDGPLDMRMNQQSPLTAEVVLNTYDAQELKHMFRLYGEVENAGLLVKKISEARSNGTIKTIEQLRQILTPLSRKGKENQYMAKVFQALRIEVNAELEVLRDMIAQASEVLADEGRFVVISYHSLEDRLVKNFFRSGNFEGKQEKDFYGNLMRPLEPLESKPVVPSDEEIEQNTRARSAKMRVATKKLHHRE